MNTKNGSLVYRKLCAGGKLLFIKLVLTQKKTSLKSDVF